MKNVIIGIDGGCFEHINPLIKKGMLPNFKRLINEGFSSKLIVPIPPVTIPSWPCLFSGLTPYQLGFYWFTHPKKGLFNSNYWKERAIFSIPSLRCFVLNIPGTYPAWKINGEMITGMLSPKFSCYPEDIKFVLRNNWIIDGDNILDIFKAFIIKKEIFLRKMDDDFNLIINVIRMPDAISHQANYLPKKTIRLINLSYKLIDNLLGTLLIEKKFDNLFLISDHGLKIYKKKFNFSYWLEKNGLLKIDNKKNNSTIKRIFVKIYYDIYRFSFHASCFKLMQNLIKNIFKKIPPELQKSGFSTIKLNESNIQHFISNVGGLFLSGNDKLKIKYIIAQLEKEKCVEKVIVPKFNYFPDIYVILKPNYLFEDKLSFFLKNRSRSINHTQTGIFIAYGKDIIKDKMDYINFYDFAPTILKLFNVKKPNYMIGNALNFLKSK